MKTLDTLRSRLAVRYFLLMIFVAMAQTLPAWNYITVYRNDGREPLMLFSDDVDSLVYSKISTDSILYEDWQVQEIWTPDTIYRIPLACIDSIRIKVVDPQQVAKNVTEVSMQVSKLFVKSESLEELVSHIETIRKIEKVEKVWTNGVSLFVKVEDWGAISFTYPPQSDPETAENNEDHTQQMIKRKVGVDIFNAPNTHTPIYDNPSDYHICIVNQTYNDKKREYERTTTKQIVKNYNDCGFHHVDVFNGGQFDKDFFNYNIYDYDVILMATHGEYDGQRHWIYTGTEYFVTDDFTQLDKWTDNISPWAHLEYMLIDEDLQRRNSPNCVSCGFLKEKRGDNDVLVCYAKVSETGLGINNRRFRGNGTAILFNTACQSLQDNYAIPNILGRKGLGYYMGYTHSNTIGWRACKEFTDLLLNGLDVVKSTQLSPQNLSQIIDETDLMGNVYYPKSELHQVNCSNYKNTHTCIIKPKTLDETVPCDGILSGKITQIDPIKTNFTYGFCISEKKDMKSSDIQGGIKFNQCKYDTSTHTVSFDVQIKDFDNYKSGKYYFCSYVWDGENYCFGEMKEFEVASKGLCPDDKHPHKIDLGLPSGTKWACCNVDTSKPKDQSPDNYGGYYAWGETEEKEYYDEVPYQNIGSNICGTQYDVAHVNKNWGENWQMPTLDHILELLENCTSEWSVFNGIGGRKFTSKNNGYSIFLPAGGHRIKSSLNEQGINGYYWAGTKLPIVGNHASGLSFDSGFMDYYLMVFPSYEGRSVRPVWVGE